MSFSVPVSTVGFHSLMLTEAHSDESDDDSSVLIDAPSANHVQYWASFY